MNEGIAQSGLEHLAFNQGGAGSNPAAFIYNRIINSRGYNIRLLTLEVIMFFIFLYSLGLAARDDHEWHFLGTLIGSYTEPYPRRQNA